MAIAGKVAITPKGEWNANTAYTKLDLVFYENASYVAIQPSTGVEPTNTSYWMLVVQSAGGADLEAIINGTTQVGNAKTLDGHEAENFFPKSGGTIDGDVALNKDSDVLLYMMLKNALRQINIEVQKGGTVRLRDATNSKDIINSTLDGTNTFNGTASGNIKYTDKPTGSYTGNGSATERRISVGGQANGVLIETVSTGGFVILDYHGGVQKTSGGTDVTGVPWGDAQFDLTNKEIVLRTTSDLLNADGVRYRYHSL